MYKFHLNDVRIRKTSTVNYADPEGKMKINVRQSIRDLAEEESEILLFMTFEMYQESEEDETEKDFYVFVEVGGNYTVEYNEKPRLNDIGMNLSRDLFPYLRSTVSTVMASAGMPPYTISPSILDSESNQN